MVKSTKIKYISVFGTVSIISMSYILSAKMLYTELYEPKKDISSEKIISTIDEKVKNNDDNSLIVSNFEPKEMSEKKISINAPKKPKIEDKSKPSILDEEIKNITLDAQELNQTSNTLAVIDNKDQESEDLDHFTKDAYDTNKSEINKITLTTKNKEIKILKTNSMSEKISTSAPSLNAIDELFNFRQYLYLNSDLKMTIKTKRALDSVAVLIKDVSGYYIEVEGYSASQSDFKLEKKLSYSYALAVVEYLKSIGIDRRIIITGYGNEYPIIEDKKDIRNSRVELKFRRETN